eukprot:765212-Hanusia_phi.AAC.5
MLLDLADRIPYNSVKEPKAAVWENFRVTTEACDSARAVGASHGQPGKVTRERAQVAEKLLWFSEQLVPRIIKARWTEEGRGLVPATM